MIVATQKKYNKMIWRSWPPGSTGLRGGLRPSIHVQGLLEIGWYPIYNFHSLDLFKFSLSSSFEVFQSSSDFGVEGLQPIERARGRHHFYIRRYYIVNILFHNGMWLKYNFWKVLFVFSPGNIRPKSMTMRKIISTTREEEEEKDQILWRPGGKFWPLEEGVANACTYISETFLK